MSLERQEYYRRTPEEIASRGDQGVSTEKFVETQIVAAQNFAQEYPNFLITFKNGGFAEQINTLTGPEQLELAKQIAQENPHFLPKGEFGSDELNEKGYFCIALAKVAQETPIN